MKQGFGNISASKTFKMLHESMLYMKHPYVEIGGVKWAAMNVGANSVTDYGLLFQWGDTQGYTADQVGIGEGQKYFGWEDYKHWNGEAFTKYNNTDGLTALEASDDAVHAAWGGSWRMPTVSEFAALRAAVTAQWVTDYQGSGVNGRLMTDKTDSSKVLFFPACGCAYDGSMFGVGINGLYWSSSLRAVCGRDYHAYRLCFGSVGINFQSHSYRYRGFAVRGVLD